MADEVSTGVTALCNYQLAFVCVHVNDNDDAVFVCVWNRRRNDLNTPVTTSPPSY